MYQLTLNFWKTVDSDQYRSLIAAQFSALTVEGDTHKKRQKLQKEKAYFQSFVTTP